MIGAGRVLLDLLPGWNQGDLDAAVRVGAELVDDRRIARCPPEAAAIGRARSRCTELFVDCGRLADVRLAAEQGLSAWLRGYECGGRIGETSGLVLARAAHALGVPFVVSGVGRRGRAAMVAAGAVGVALDAQTWGLEGSPLHPAQRARVLEAREARDTEVFGELVDTRVRVLTRAPPEIRRGLAQAAAADGHAMRMRAEADLARWWTRPEAAIPAPESIGEASAFASCGTLAAAVRRVSEQLADDLAGVRDHHPLRSDPLGAGTLVVQGPMAHVAEGEPLAAAVSAAGAVPFGALSALRPTDAREVLDRIRRAAGGMPWGAGLIGFDVMPHRDAHIALLDAARPDHVIVAGGSPALAAALGAAGHAVWLHASSPTLLREGWRRGVRRFVLEGHEAGGHVGRLSSLALWEEGLAQLEHLVPHEDGGAALVVLAGGIGDAFSAAVAGAMAARAAAAGCRVALQAGTAFMLTAQCRAGGQITEPYAHAARDADSTLLVGSSVGLPMRCPVGPFAAEARAIERELLASDAPLAERRERLEQLNLGRTRLAARGLIRAPDHETNTPRYQSAPEERIRREAAFTMGQGASLQRATSVAELVRALSTGAAEHLDAIQARRASRWGGVRPVAGGPKAAAAAPAAAPVSLVARSSPSREPIAVVSVGCVLPDAHDVPAYWRNLVDGHDAIREVPPDRWLIERYWDPAAGPRGPAATRSKLAGVVREFTFDELKFRIPPRVAETMDPSQRLALEATWQAVNAWPGAARVDRDRAAVILGNAMGGEFAKSLALRIRQREVMAIVREDAVLAHLDAESLDDLARRVEHALAATLPPLNVNSMSGLLANVIAGRVAAWLDWRGGNLTTDAACASSLAAIAQGVDWLRAGRVDVVLTGGVDTDLAPETFVAFNLTGALSSAGSRPFATGADGFVMGEGCAVFVLKRLSDAQRDGDPIWGVVRGVGMSSDGRGRGITAPRPEGQRLAIRRAWEDAGLDLRTACMIEAHGTGTSVGDATEATVLSELLTDAAAPVWLGSVKSMLGHLKAAAGAAGTLKTLLSLATGVVPPTLNAGPVDPELRLADSPLRLPRRAVFLGDSPAQTAGVSAFGFGGTNYHLVVQAPPGGAQAPAPLAAIDSVVGGGVGVAAWGAPTLAALAASLDSAAHPPAQAGAAAFRLAIAATPDSLATSLTRARAALKADVRAPIHPAIAWGSGPPLPVVGLVPGQGSCRVGGVAAARVVPAGAAALAELEGVLADILAEAGARGTPHQLVALEREGDGPARSTLRQHIVLYALAVAWGAVLRGSGIELAGVVGHSLGEYGALAVAGALEPIEGLRLVVRRGLALDACPPGSMLAVQLPAEDAQAEALRDGLVVAAINDPHHTVLAGPSEAIAVAAARLSAAGVACRPLHVAHAFHSPWVADAVPPLREALEAWRPRPATVPCWSAQSGVRFDADPRAALLQATQLPVQFHAALCSMVDEVGAGVAVELGPRQVLCRLAVDARPALSTVPVDSGSAGASLGRAASALLAAGHAGLATSLFPQPLAAPIALFPRESPSIDRPAPTSSPTPPPSPELASRAAAVIDLRIAALADPRHQAAYERSRAALVEELATRDAGEGARRPADREVAPPPAPPPTSDTRAAVIAALCEVTGYPEDFLTPDADLEADLGVDSIRKLEVLGLLEQRLGFSTDESDYGALSDIDLDGLVAHVDAQLAAPQRAAAARPRRADAQLVGELWLRAPAAPLSALDLPPAGPPRFTSTGQVLWPVGSCADARTDDVLEVLIELRTWAAATTGPVHRLTVVAPRELVGAAAVAAARSLARERGWQCRAVWAAGGSGRRLMGEVLHAREQDAAVAAADTTLARRAEIVAQGSPPLPDRPTVIASGGAAGIVAASMAPLAVRGARITLLGRGELDADTPRGAEHRAGVEALRAAGATVRWAPCDLLDADAVAVAAAEARVAFGPADLVIHGAGVLRYAPFERLSDADLRAVVAIKLAGAHHLARATAEDEPTWWIAYSSLAAGHGNPGQVAYAAANAALEHVRHPSATRHLALRWTAWAGRGMASPAPVQRLLASRGVTPLALEAGAAALQRALTAQGCVEVVAGASPAGLGWPLGAVESADQPVRVRLPIRAESPEFADHRPGGRAIVAAAVWLTAWTRAAQLWGEPTAWVYLTDLDITAPTLADRDRDDVVVEIERSGAARIVAGGSVVATARLESAPAHAARDGVAVPLLGADAQAWYRPELWFHGPAWRAVSALSMDDRGVVADLDAPQGTAAIAAIIDGVHQLAAVFTGHKTGALGLPVGAASWWLRRELGPGPWRASLEEAADGLHCEVRAYDGEVVALARGVRMRGSAPYPADAPAPQPVNRSGR